MENNRTQIVGRVAALIRLVAAHPDGVTTRQLAELSQLPRPTVHRLLASLAAEGLLDRSSDGHMWLLGPELFVVGAAAQRRFAIETVARPTLRRLAAETGESAFLSVRRGSDVVCLMREEGSFPIRSFVLYVGARFPIGVGSAGLAIAAFLDDDELDKVLAENAVSRRRLEGDHSAARVSALVAETRRVGYSVNPGAIVEGSWGMGGAVFNANSEPQWALSITGVESRFREDRRVALGRVLLNEAHALSQQLQ